MRPLRTRRLEAGWTQKELARAAGVSHGAVSRLERNGPVRPETRQAVELALAVRMTQMREMIGEPLVRLVGAAAQSRPS